MTDKDNLIEKMRDIDRQCGINESEYADSYYRQFTQLFVEQACEAVHALFKDNRKQEDIFYTDIAQALRDEFK